MQSGAELKDVTSFSKFAPEYTITTLTNQLKFSILQWIQLYSIVEAKPPYFSALFVKGTDKDLSSLKVELKKGAVAGAVFGVKIS